MVEILRTLWTVAEQSDDDEQAKLKRDITQPVQRLKRQIDRRLGRRALANSMQSLLFDKTDAEPSPHETFVTAPTPTAAPRFPETSLHVYAKDFADHALQHLPQSAKFQSVTAFRDYLADKLRFNFQATRRRTANYIVSRFFPGDVFNEDLPQFAAATARTPALGEALFYPTCRIEKIVAMVADEVVYPSLAQGGVSRTRIRAFVQAQFPGSKSVEDMGQAIVRTYAFFGIGTGTRSHLKVGLRDGQLAAFAYVMHLEFPEPGMHAFEKMFDGPMHRWLLSCTTSPGCSPAGSRSKKS